MADARIAAELRRSLEEGRLFVNPRGSRSLMVFTHGFRQKPVYYEPLLHALLSEENEEHPLASCDLLPFEYDAGVFANTDLSEVAASLTDLISSVFQNGDYERVFLVGHSMGGLLLRQTVVHAALRRVEEDSRVEWLDCDLSLVLLASTNRGFVIRGMARNTGYALARLFRRSRLVRDAHRESRWLNNLWLGWLVAFQGGDAQAPRTVHIRGSEDEVVGAYDSLEAYSFSNTVERTLDGVRHRDFQGITRAHPGFATIRDAFLDPKAGPAFAQKRAGLSARDGRRKLLVFLIHGIRDFGEWQDSLATEIETLEPDAKVISVRYGYFNLFQFLLGFQRDRAVRSFVTRYIEVVRKLNVPLSRLSIVAAAHSNGTYVLANALKQYRRLIVDRAYMAGSVLPRKFDWAGLGTTELGRLTQVRNDAANADWPVGVLCAGLRPVMFNSLGTAGYAGFNTSPKLPTITNNKWLDGGHGAAFVPSMHRHVAQYLVKGQPTRPPVIARRRWWLRIANFLSILLLPGTALLLYLAYIAGIGGIAQDWLQVSSSAALTVLLILLLVRI